MKIQNANGFAVSWIALWCLRIVISLQCIGVAGRYVLSEYETESDVYSFLFFDCGWPEPVSQLIDDVGAYGCLLAGILLLFNGAVVQLLAKRNADSTAAKRFRLIDGGILVFVATWMLALAATQMIRGGAFAEFTIGEHAVRFTIPIVLLVLLLGLNDSSRKCVIVATGLLVFATAITFAVHGYKAQQVYGPFVDLIILSDQQTFHLDIEQSAAERFLVIIGWVDILLAALLLATRWRIVVVYMSFWGLITALSRMSAFGIVAWPETLIRASNAGAPFVLLILNWHLVISGRSELKSDM